MFRSILARTSSADRSSREGKGRELSAGREVVSIQRERSSFQEEESAFQEQGQQVMMGRREGVGYWEGGRRKDGKAVKAFRNARWEAASAEDVNGVVTGSTHTKTWR